LPAVGNEGPFDLENPQYTGYAIFGRRTKYETLLNPDDVGAGSSCGSSGRRLNALFGFGDVRIRRLFLSRRSHKRS
jgi:hypothetical protein